ncbi:bifunctional glycosyltransferase/CDP-glycerol:glycerophosphate glycerophosphotransferase [Heyndrickxia sporothermodurans]|uniref:bifunctional glycosyltransferase/CDP-glycerol:glycerophosphate glycerophosphotransferase n=1 Tax=Heyndrickxia sporothermodurans TaxID=46224 RepID=UPI0035D95F43
MSYLLLKHKNISKEYKYTLSLIEQEGEYYYFKSLFSIFNDSKIPLNIGDWEVYMVVSGTRDGQSFKKYYPIKSSSMKTLQNEQEHIGLSFLIYSDVNFNLSIRVSHTNERRLNPKISVIVPIYNVEEFLEECLESLVNQTMRDFEVIMVDDGSTDSSKEIMKLYANKYSVFIPVYKENGGLGHARNYGVSYASGEYLIFMDSDDYISNDAYEKLYSSAINSGSDIVIGNVRRFNSATEYASGLHKKVFKETIIGTHISKNHELIYDTTAWNKLFKKSFWDNNQFMFPEGILYEDIPVTIPAHFLSTSTDVLTDVVYYWRARDGASKSITQQRDQLNNFIDRLKVVNMVDQFFDKNNINKDLKMEKDYKTLNVDILLYLNTLDVVDEEYREKFITLVSDYLTRVEPESINRLNAIDRLKYYFVKNKDTEKILEVLAFQKEELNKTKIKREGNRYYGDYPYKGYLTRTLFDVTEELQVERQIRLVEWRGSELYIEGYAYIDKIDMRRKHSVELKAYVLNPDTMKKMEVPVELQKRTDVTHKKGIEFDAKIPLKRLYNYNWSGFNISIDFNNEDVIALGEGRLEVWMDLNVGSVSRKFRVGGPIAGSKPRPDLYVTDDQRIFPKYNAAWDLVIETSFLTSVINKIVQHSNELILEGWTKFPLLGLKIAIINWSKNIKKYYRVKEKSTSNNNDNVNWFELKINLEELNSRNSYGDWSGYILYEKQRYPLTLLKNVQNNNFLYVNGLVESEVNINPAGNLNINFGKIKPKITSTKWDDNKLKLSMNVHKNILLEFDEIHLMNVNLSKRDTSEKFKFKIDKKVTQNNNLDISVEVNVEENGMVILEPGIWDLYFEIDGVKDNIRKSLSRRIEANESLVNKENIKIFSNMKFIVYCTKMDNFSIKTILDWNWIERGPRRQEIIRKALYPILRWLPINKKTVVFESYWGKSYSCNPKALYEYMCEEYKDYKFVWFFNNENTIVKGNAQRVRKNSLKYFYYLARAKYFINNVNFPDFYRKRKGAIEVQTMHGTPLKTMGLDVPGETDTKEKREKLLNRCGRWDYLVTPSHYVTDIAKRAFCFNKQLLEVGYPRNDILMKNRSIDDLNNIKRKFNIPLDKKVIMYAPTWRVKKGFQLELDLDKLQQNLSTDYVIVLRLHYFVSSTINVDKYKGFVFDLSSHNDIQELYLISDTLITDYSSVMFDYAILNRPILFFTYDLESYRDNLRGFYIDFETEAPGPLLRTTEEIVDSILNLEDIKREYSEKFNEFRNKYCQFDEGDASRKVIEKVLNR